MQSSNPKLLLIRSAAELGIIIAGVLLALAANNWWSDRMDRIEEREILHAISEDLDATTDLLKDATNNMTTVIEAIRILSEGTTGPARDLSDEALKPVLWRGVWETPGFRVQMSAYGEVEQSGRMRLLEDPELRRALARYDQLYNEASESRDDAFQHQTTKVDPYIIKMFEVSQFSRISVEDNKGVKPLAELPATVDHRVFIDDTYLQNLIRTKYVLLQYERKSLKDLQSSIDELKVLVRRSLNDQERYKVD